MSDMFRLDGKVAVVIGGAGGIGEIMAKGLAAQGAKVAVASRNLQKITDIAKIIQTETKSETVGLSVDVTDKASVDALAEEVLKKFGPWISWSIRRASIPRNLRIIFRWPTGMRCSMSTFAAPCWRAAPSARR